MNAAVKRLNETFGRKARAWAHRRQGTDPRSGRLASRRIYILPTRAGVIYAAVMLAMLLGSMNYSNNLGFALTFLLSSIGIISIYHCHRNIADTWLHFTGSQPAFSGESVRFNFVVENQSNYVRTQLRFGHDGRQEICDTLATGARQQVSVRIDSTHRGWLKLPRLLLSTRYPLGLLRAWAWINMDISEVVYPQPASIAPASRTNHAGTTTSGQSAHGDDDFSGLRNYRLGDPPKRIAWKVLARTGEMLVSEYHGGAPDLTWIDWHDHPVGDTEERLALLTKRVLDADVSGSAWGLRLPDRIIGPERGATHRHQCLQALALYDANPGSANPRSEDR